MYRNKGIEKNFIVLCTVKEELTQLGFQAPLINFEEIMVLMLDYQKRYRCFREHPLNWTSFDVLKLKVFLVLTVGIREVSLIRNLCCVFK